ncbi:MULTISPECIES: DUF6415 family natural product biosynthesis protein [Streptomyces]|uniref:Uncharacterized protein n=1 Tax=Streptomyces koelreuteriae TaxID=2838015 RepID=A0ABX8FUI1_9ACTN|nr:MULTISPECIES: DUF6415 family natural product biosynthesis protein [Streptomyces]QWB24772.1 hypothetical protein KJK29_20535 [Streptomyces koelreuteriae]UUA07787.1 DUF6415 family natural product biosynthesis protein [Streptomyces koelreuteriae]UUA15416.1 DUF6415 family natural product biosynthesis protein [Streptomyces sp. CRCS-T-1]
MTAPVSRTALPLDLETMRACADRLLANDTDAPRPGSLETLTLHLRGRLMLVVPEVETAALALPEDSAARACASFCIGEARLRLSASARGAHAQRLARSVRTLCDHYENEDHECPTAPERAAYLCMLLHCPACPDCRAVDDDGEAIGSCVTGDRLYEEYRQARRGGPGPRERPPTAQ